MMGVRPIALLAGLAFAAGGLAGAAIHHRLTCRECAGVRDAAPPPAAANGAAANDAAWSRAGRTWAEDQADGWTRALELAPSQRERVVALIAEAKPEYERIYSAVRARRRDADREFRARLRETLTQAQRDRLDALVESEERRRRAYYGTSQAAAEEIETGLGEDEEAAAGGVR